MDYNMERDAFAPTVNKPVHLKDLLLYQPQLPSHILEGNFTGIRYFIQDSEFYINAIAKSKI